MRHRLGGQHRTASAEASAAVTINVTEKTSDMRRSNRVWSLTQSTTALMSVLRPGPPSRCSFHNKDSGAYLRGSRDDRTDTGPLSPRHHRLCHQTHRRRRRSSSSSLENQSAQSSVVLEDHLNLGCYILPPPENTVEGLNNERPATGATDEHIPNSSHTD